MAMVCLLAALSVQLSVSASNDGHIMRCGTIGSCPSAAISEIAKRCWSLFSVAHVSGAIASVQTVTFTFTLLYYHVTFDASRCFVVVEGDSLSAHKNKKFSTKDQDNDLHASASCAKVYKGAWWYARCHASNLNGLYLGGPHTSFADGVNWQTWTGYYYSLKISEMKIRPVRG